MVWFVLGIIVLAIAAWWFLQRGKHGATPAHHSGLHHKPPAAMHKIWGKQLVIPMGSEACQIAHDLEGKCFSLAKTPSIPLAGCTHANCHCCFEPLAERRSHLERRSGKERRPTLRFEPGKTDRRSGNDRREENRNPFAVERD